MMEKNKDKFNGLVSFFAWCWVILWFLAIWVEGYHFKLFVTGIFCLLLGMVLNQATKK